MAPRFSLFSTCAELFQRYHPYESTAFVCTASAKGSKLPIPVRMLPLRAALLPDQPAVVVRLSDDLVKIRRNSRLSGLLEKKQEPLGRWNMEVNGYMHWYEGYKLVKTEQTEETRLQIERCNERLGWLVEERMPIVRPKVKSAEKKVKPRMVGLNDRSREWEKHIKRSIPAGFRFNRDLTGTKLPTPFWWREQIAPLVPVRPEPSGTVKVKAIRKRCSFYLPKGTSVKFVPDAKLHVYEPLPIDEAAENMQFSRVSFADDKKDGHHKISFARKCNRDVDFQSLSNRQRRLASAARIRSLRSRIPTGTGSQSSESSYRRHIQLSASSRGTIRM